MQEMSTNLEKLSFSIVLNENENEMISLLIITKASWLAPVYTEQLSEPVSIGKYCFHLPMTIVFTSSKSMRARHKIVEFLGDKNGVNNYV